MFFVNRKNELDILADLRDKKGFKSLLLYGRRRIGKTYLLKNFIRNKDGIYFLAQKRNIRENLDMFGKILYEHSIPDVKAENFIELFQKIKSYVKNKIIIIDEFQYLIESDKSILSDFQYIFDEVLYDTEMFMIFCGSSIGLIEKIGTDLNSPLYGRFSSRMKLNRMTFRSIKMFHKEKNFEELVLIYAALGGIPLYHNYFDKDNSFESNVGNTFFNNSHPLYSEAEFLLRQELRDITTYMGILNAIANGKTRVSEISNAIYVPARDLPKYLSVLKSLDLIHKITPINAKINTKSSIYKISDNYYRFWFRYVVPNKSKIEFFNKEEALSFLANDLSTYIGHIVEDIILELFREKYTRVGRWWFRDNEIDLIAVDEIKNEVIFLEIKWKNKKINPAIAERLIKTSKMVKGFENYKKKYIIISRNGFSKYQKLGQNTILWDKNDLINRFDL